MEPLIISLPPGFKSWLHVIKVLRKRYALNEPNVRADDVILTVCHSNGAVDIPVWYLKARAFEEIVHLLPEVHRAKAIGIAVIHGSPTTYEGNPLRLDAENIYHLSHYLK
jgi:hypothetical protein